MAYNMQGIDSSFPLGHKFLTYHCLLAGLRTRWGHLKRVLQAHEANVLRTYIHEALVSESLRPSRPCILCRVLYERRKARILCALQ